MRRARDGTDAAWNQRVEKAVERGTRRESLDDASRERASAPFARGGVRLNFLRVSDVLARVVRRARRPGRRERVGAVSRACHSFTLYSRSAAIDARALERWRVHIALEIRSSDGEDERRARAWTHVGLDVHSEHETEDVQETKGKLSRVIRRTRDSIRRQAENYAWEWG